MKNLLPALFGFILALSIAHTSLGQDCNLSIRGKVIHLENNQPIYSAYIWLEEINSGTLTDENGNFQLKGLCPGQYTLKIQYLGHKEIIESINLSSSPFNKTYRMEEESLELSGVEIHGHKDAIQTTTAVTALYGEALFEARGENLGESLKRIAGVTTFSTGNSIAKPVIHGLHSNRIMILNNGIRLEGQQWGAEHAPEIDPFIADEITVIKGAETVRFGPEAMGGVILVNPGELPVKKEHTTNLYVLGASNGRMGNINMTHTGGSGKIPGLGYRIQTSAKKAGNIKSPDYYQGNTGLSELNFSGTLGYTSKKLGVEGYYSYFNTELGILRDSHTGNLSDLQEIIANGRPFTDAEFTYDLINPKQVVTHHLVKLKSHYHLNPNWKANIQYGFQMNNRKEFDKRRGDLNERASLDLELFTNTLDIFIDHTHVNAFSGTWGLNLIQQANNNVPGTGVTPLIPNYDMLNLGLYGMEKYSKGPFELEAGARFDIRSVSTARYIQEELETADLSYRNFTAFLGAYYQISEKLEFSSNIGSAWRPPNVNELFSQGLHHGAAAVEIGDQNLESEKSLKWVSSLEYSGKKSLFEITVYANKIKNYIYLNPTGETYSSLRGTFNVYEYLQANAMFYGLDFSGSYEFSEQISGYVKGAITRAKNLDEDNFFPFIPSDRMDWGLSYSFGKDGKKNKVTLSNQLVAKQKREPDFDLAPAPPAYALFGIGYMKKMTIGQNKLNAGIQVNNIFNTSYKEYMNRFRYFTDDIGRNIQLKINYQF
ncbi:TonB-dependent receptor [Algoriphagus sp. CAU 1675]|uniref:TonB-dependent receptor n=1 Tax=Algoriphagus sp. CAU 1675 TaxID=3032597 RepID=UPI0023DA3851|nr:TonB-dependent receptor [Algoriphagus sp. CAU 1675]MDF2158082.1 TonB-dependent receptor [Algoriphagus sp. CAU 1675]